jgi:hypothetical protein|tara:strand:- start:4382 stop:4735 length:354 start_codon:yes stop_codon:yes gene_type:complete
MNYRQYVLDNQKIIRAIKDSLPGDDFLDKLFATLDVACARFNTILLKLIQEPLKADEYNKSLIECKKAIDKFYYYTNKYRFGSNMMRWYYKIVIHLIGTRQIPKIRILLATLERYDT